MSEYRYAVVIKHPDDVAWLSMLTPGTDTLELACVFSGEVPTLFKTRAEAAKAIRRTRLTEQLRKERGEVYNSDYVEDIALVSILKMKVQQ